MNHWSRGAVRAFATASVALTIPTGCDRAPDTVGADVATPRIYRASDVELLGGSESIAVVQDLEVLDDGTVWVLNSVEPFFVGFDPTGFTSGEHGTAGGGPEELRAPSTFVTGGFDGRVWVLDRIRHALVEVSEPDSEWSEIPLPRDSIPPGSLVPGRDLTDNRIRAARLDDEIVFARTTGTISSGMFSFWLANWGAELMALDPATGAVRKILSLGETLEDPLPYIERSGDFPPFPLWFRHWAVCGDASLRVYDRPGNQVRTFAPDGAELEATPLPPVTLTAVTRRQFARAVLGLLMAERLGTVGLQVSPADSLELLNSVVQDAEGDPEQLATVLPRYVDFRCDDDGTLWLRPFDVDAGGLKGGPGWLRIAPDGGMRDVRLPERFDPLRFTPDRVWGVLRDELDVPTVGWITLDVDR